MNTRAVAGRKQTALSWEKNLTGAHLGGWGGEWGCQNNPANKIEADVKGDRQNKTDDSNGIRVQNILQVTIHRVWEGDKGHQLTTP